MLFDIKHPIAIPLEDEQDLVHTDNAPFCSDPSCTCHRDPELLVKVAQFEIDGLLTLDEATRLVWGRQL